MKPRDALASPLGLALLATLLALVVRLVAAPHFTFQGSDCDGAGYWDVARSIAQGKGWLGHSYRFLYLPPPDLPGPDVHWSPLYPLLMAGAFRLLGESMAAARGPMLIAGALLAGALVLFTWRLTGSRRAAGIAGLLAALHPTLVVWSLRLETEVGTMLLVTLSLWALARQESWRDAALAGLLLGLAWLMKYQSGLLLVAAFVTPLLAGKRGAGFRRLLVTLGVFVLVIAPWLIRSALLFGDPFFSAVGPMVLSGFREFGSEREFITRTTPPPATLPFLLSHLPEAFGRAVFGLRYLVTGLLRDHLGGLLMAPLLVVGGVAVMNGAWRRWLPALAWALALTAACAVSIHQVRYLLSLLPLLVALAAAAVTLRRPAAAARLAAFTGLLAAGQLALAAHAAVTASGEGWTPGAMSCAIEAEVAAPPIRARTAPGEAIFATEVYHYALVTGRNAVNIPPRNDDLRRLQKRYDIRILAIAEEDLPVRLPSWGDAPPAWAVLDTVVVPAAGHGTSPVRLYRLTPPDAPAPPDSTHAGDIAPEKKQKSP